MDLVMKGGNYLRLFDNKKYISLDIGSRKVKVVEGKAYKKNIIIQNAYTIEIPRNVYSDGIILDMEQLSYLLKTSLKDKRIKSNSAIVVINSSKIITREMLLPNVSDEEIKSILNYQIEDFIPIEPEDYQFQFLRLGSVFEDGVEKLNILLIAIPKIMVETHLKLIDNVGLKPQVMDFQGNALSKLLNYNDVINELYPTKGKTIVTVDMGYLSTKINIVLDGVLKVSRVIEGSIYQIIERVQENIDISEGEIISQIKGIDLKDETNIGIESSNIIESLNNTINTILDGVDMVIKYYNSRDIGNKIDYILLHGGLSYLNGLEDRFSTLFNISTSRLNSLDKIKSNVDMGVYSNAVGGLIRLNEV